MYKLVFGGHFLRSAEKLGGKLKPNLKSNFYNFS